MEKKPTYDELLATVKVLQDALSGCKSIEQLLWNSQQLLHSVLNSLEAVIYVADMETHEILFVNKYTANIFGDVVGKKCWQSLQANQSGPCPFCTSNKLLDQDGRPAGAVTLTFQNTLDKRWYDVRDKAIPWIDGRVVRLEIASDITEQKATAEKLKMSEEKFRTIADFNYDWEYWIDPRGNYVYISPSCEKLTGYTPEEFQTNPDLMNTLTHPDDRPLIAEHLTKKEDREHVCHFDFRIITRDGLERWIAHSCQPVFDRKGNYLGRRASNRNVTKRKLAEKESERLIVELKAAMARVKLLSGFLPICASCKKIRDDQGYWKQIESYIREHSEAEFSHGICPDCAKKLYPEFTLPDLPDKKK
jgi:PAS domain S-box-containing protein